MAKNKKTGLTEKQTKFCQVYVQTGNASEALRQAYDCSKYTVNSVKTQAYEYLQNIDIQAYIEKLQKKAQERTLVTLESLTAEYDQLKAMGVSLEQISAAVSALNGKAKIHGFDKSTIDLKLPKVIRKDLTGKK